MTTKAKAQKKKSGLRKVRQSRRGLTKSAKRRPGPPVAPPPESIGAVAAATGMVLTWEDDPESHPIRTPISVAAPSLPIGPLGITISEPAPPVDIQPVGTSRFRYWVAVEALSRGMRFW